MAAEGSADGAGACDFFEEIAFDPLAEGTLRQIAAEDHRVGQDWGELVSAGFGFAQLNALQHRAQFLQQRIAGQGKLMGLYKATIYRQTMFAEFEEIAFNMVENGEVLTQEVLCDKYYELNKKYFGDAVVIDSDIRYEWLRIPHFYYKFYVYKYAIGLSAATHIVKRLLSDNTYKDKYIQFLSCGSKLSPNESLKLADVDLTKPEVVESALDYFKEIQDEFIKLCNNE